MSGSEVTPRMPSSLRWIAMVGGSSWFPSEEQLQMLYGQETQEEVERMKKFLKSEDSRRSLMARMLLRSAASFVLGKEASAIKFGRTKGMKPYIQEEEAALRGLNVNVSHHGDWVALAMEEKGLVGVDVTTTCAPRANLTAEAYFQILSAEISQKELTAIRRAGRTDKEQFFAFFVIWALKEAYTKAVGIGTALPFARLELDIPDSALRMLSSDTPRRLDVDGKVKAYLDGILQRSWEFEIYYLGDGTVWADNISYSGDSSIMAVAIGPHAAAVPSYKAAMKSLTGSRACSAAVDPAPSSDNFTLKGVPIAQALFGADSEKKKMAEAFLNNVYELGPSVRGPRVEAEAKNHNFFASLRNGRAAAMKVGTIQPYLFTRTSSIGKKASARKGGPAAKKFMRTRSGGEEQMAAQVDVTVSDVVLHHAGDGEEEQAGVAASAEAEAMSGTSKVGERRAADSYTAGRQAPSWAAAHADGAEAHRDADAIMLAVEEPVADEPAVGLTCALEASSKEDAADWDAAADDGSEVPFEGQVMTRRKASVVKACVAAAKGYHVMTRKKTNALADVMTRLSLNRSSGISKSSASGKSFSRTSSSASSKQDAGGESVPTMLADAVFRASSSSGSFGRAASSASGSSSFGRVSSTASFSRTLSRGESQQILMES